MRPETANMNRPAKTGFAVKRKAAPVPGKRRHIGLRPALALAGAIAIPALAAPDEWKSLEIGGAENAESSMQPMPFERAGQSFPGSAYYYLSAGDAQSGTGNAWSDLAPDAHSDAQPAIGPAARALRIDNSGVDRNRALQCLTAAIYYEAASEPDAGQRAVAQVVLNRVAHPAYPNTVCGVVYQGSERSTGCQFTFTCDGSLARKPVRLFWDRARNVALAALGGYVYAPAGLATHYHTIQVHPYWADSLRFLGTIGSHRFYGFSGKAGQPTAFRFAYLGGEPLAAPHPHSEAAADKASGAPDPVAIQNAYAARPDTTSAQAETIRYAAPAYTEELEARGGDALYNGEKLPSGSGIRPEYSNSGRWLSQPGA